MTLNIDHLTATDVMTSAPASLPADCTMGCAYRLFLEHGVHGAPVVGQHGELVGVATMTDLLEALGGVLDPEGLSSDQLMELDARKLVQIIPRAPVSCSEDFSLTAACQLMVKERVHRLIVTQHGVPTGILSAIDVVRAIACLADQRERMAVEIAEDAL